MQSKNGLSWESARNDDKITLRLAGELSRNTLLPLWRQRYSFLPAEKLAGQSVVWELAGITRIDSAGFALLCDFIQLCRSMKVNRQNIVHAPVQLVTLADLFGLADWMKPFLQFDGKLNGNSGN